MNNYIIPKKMKLYFSISLFSSIFIILFSINIFGDNQNCQQCYQNDIGKCLVAGECNKKTVGTDTESVECWYYDNDKNVYKRMMVSSKACQESEYCYDNPEDNGKMQKQTCGHGTCKNTIDLCGKDGEDYFKQECTPLPNEKKEICDGINNDCDTDTEGNSLIDEGFDWDKDKVANCFDNCPRYANPDQSYPERNVEKVKCVIWSFWYRVILRIDPKWLIGFAIAVFVIATLFYRKRRLK